MIEMERTRERERERERKREGGRERKTDFVRVCLCIWVPSVCAASAFVTEFSVL